MVLKRVQYQKLGELVWPYYSAFCKHFTCALLNFALYSRLMNCHFPKMCARAKCERGISLIEIMFSIAILRVALLAVISMVVQAYEANLLNRNRAAALDEARGILEEIRAFRLEVDSDEDFQEQLLKAFPEGRRRYASPVLAEAARVIGYDGLEKDPITIDVEVQWLDIRNRRMQVTLSTFLSRYR